MTETEKFDRVNKVYKKLHKVFIKKLINSFDNLSNEETLSLITIFGLDCFMFSLKTVSHFTGSPIYELYKNMKFDKKIRKISCEFENNK